MLGLIISVKPKLNVREIITITIFKIILSIFDTVYEYIVTRDINKTH